MTTLPALVERGRAQPPASLYYNIWRMSKSRHRKHYMIAGSLRQAARLCAELNVNNYPKYLFYWSALCPAVPYPQRPIALSAHSSL